MIIACPACATRYVVPDSAIGVDGRTVRCAKCRHSWFQDGPVLERPAPSPPPPPPPAVIEEAENRGLKQQMLSAQVHASSFYERFGFSVVSGEFLDAGIPHVDMVRHSN